MPRRHPTPNHRNRNQRRRYGKGRDKRRLLYLKRSQNQ